MNIRKAKQKLVKTERMIEKRGPQSFFESFFLTIWQIYRIVKKSLVGSKHPLVAQSVIALKNAERHFISGAWSFITFEELTLRTLEWAETLPRFDLIIGIPRSGLLVASILAMRQAVPLSTPGQKSGNFWASKHIHKREPQRILLVDDSVSTGASLKKAYEEVTRAYPKARIETGALIVSRESRPVVDYFGFFVEPPRLFEWNFLHSKKGKVAFDLDGVIAEDPEPGLRDDMPAYRKWTENAHPRFVPAYKIDAIISNRPESVRTETEKWLSEHRVDYGELLLDTENASASKHDHKINSLRIVKPDFFVESSISEAETIMRETRIPVLCVDNHRFYQ